MERNSRFNIVLIVMTAGIWIYIMYKVLPIYFRRGPDLSLPTVSAKPPNVKYGYMLSLKYDIPFDIGEKPEKKKQDVQPPPPLKPAPLRPCRYIGKICNGKEEVMVLEIDGMYVYTAEDAGLNGNTCRIVSHFGDTVSVKYNDMIFNVCVKEK